MRELLAGGLNQDASGVRGFAVLLCIIVALALARVGLPAGLQAILFRESARFRAGLRTGTLEKPNNCQPTAYGPILFRNWSSRGKTDCEEALYLL
jgi:hypothetical protein